MLRFFIKRLLLAVVTLFAISITVFAIFFLGPANPAELLCGNKACTQAQVETVNKAMGFDKPAVEQYANYMSGIFFGREIGSNKVQCHAPCLGLNFRTGEQVSDIIGRTMPVTFSIVLGAAVIYILIGTGLGMISAVRRGTVFDRVASGTSLFFASQQIYFLGPLLMLLLVYSTGIFKQPSYTPLMEDPLAWAGGLILPWITLGLINSAQYARLSRAQMIETLNEDFIRTARAKGLSMAPVYFRHALRAAITPIVTIAGLDIGGQLGGVVITETTFSLQGMGRTSVRAIFEQNLNIVMAVVFFSALFVVVSNILVDVLYALIDPRVKLGSTGH